MSLHAAGVLGGTKVLSTSTRTGVRCPVVEKLASPQQAPGSPHGEVRASILQKTGPEDFPGSGNRTGVCCHCGLSFMS